MSFSTFHGNAPTVHAAREMLARDRFPHAVILSGPRGAGKFTLAQMIAKAMNCLEPPITSDGLPDYCGHCSNCERIAQADDLNARFDEAVDAREALKETDKKETRIFVQTHPDVLIIPPDPPQLLVKVDQVRHVIGHIYYKPTAGEHKVYVFPSAIFMKEAANSLLKILEEPPEFATIFLLSENPSSLLATVRSRCVQLRLECLACEDIEAYLSKHRPEWQARQRALVARLCGGGIGQAQTFDLAAYTAARQDALTLLRASINADDHTELFKVTEGYRAGAQGKDKTDQLLRAAYSLLEDLLYIVSGTPKMLRNTDLSSELNKLASTIDIAWIQRASLKLGEVETGMRRNLLRSLSLDAFATSLER
ncbi:MAG TPA: DNA polymerase III subunit delta' [Candidatus Koribacter sp.]|jgi:DNA polymerase-3 subunit delta'